jgi:hypothetical protein
MRPGSTLFVSLLLGALTACGPSGGGNGGGGDDDGNDGPDASPGDKPDAWQPPPLTPDANGTTDPPPDPADACTKMDIVFVVDSSGSMGDEQMNLATNFTRFAEILDSYRVSTGEPLDYRVALTTTARTFHEYYEDWLGRTPNVVARNAENGAFRQPNGAPRRWIEGADADRAAMLAAIARVGTEGSHLEMPLDAAQLALSTQAGAGQSNAGFVREDALLAIVYLTDEEDCSRDDGRSTQDAILIRTGLFDPTEEEQVCGSGLAAPQKYIDFFDQLKGDRKRWATAVIAGDGMGRPTCGGSGGLGTGAEDAPRLKQFVQLTGGNAIFRTICQPDLAPALKDALDTFQAACETLPPVDD